MGLDSKGKVRVRHLKSEVNYKLNGGNRNIGEVEGSNKYRRKEPSNNIES